MHDIDNLRRLNEDAELDEKARLVKSIYDAEARLGIDSGTDYWVYPWASLRRRMHTLEVALAERTRQAIEADEASNPGLPIIWGNR